MPVLVDERIDLVFVRMKSALMLVDPAKFPRINFDITKGVGVVVGHLKEIRAQFPELFALPGFNRKAAEEIEDRAKVLLYLHNKCASPSAESEELDALFTESRKLLSILNLQGSTIVARGLMSDKDFAGVTNGNGYLNNAQDLGIISTKLSDNFDSIKTKMEEKKLVFPLSRTELERGLDLSYKVLQLASRREQTPEIEAENIELRLRACVLFLESYDEIRAGLGYTRRKMGDAEEIAPSLYGTRKARGETASNAHEDTTPTVVAPAVPAVAQPRSVPLGAQGGSPFRD